MKAIIVARVSTEEQKDAGNSLPAQETRLKDYCNKKSFEIIKPYSFEESAYKKKRDEFDTIVEHIQEVAEKEKLAVCFDKVDRFSRGSVFDKRVGLLYEMALADKIELHFVSDGQVISNQMSAVEKFQFGMSLGLAKYYSDAIGDNVKRAFEQKRRNGEWTGAVRLGYLNISLDVEKRLRKDIVVDPERSHLIQKIFEMYATGNYSMETIRKEITTMGLRSLKGYELSKSCIENILADSFYCGTAVSRIYGSYIHKYPRLISKELFDKCQALRTSKRKKLQKMDSKEYIFKTLLTCKNCGCTMTPTTAKEKFIYYSCTNSKGICKREYVPEKELLKPIYSVFDRFEKITKKTQNDLLEELRKNTETELVFHKAQINRIRNQYEQIQLKDGRLLEAYIDQSITKEIYDKKHQELQDKLQVLNIELEEHTKADYDYKTTITTIISVARRAKEIFKGSEIYEKRVLLNYLLQNPTVNGKKLDFAIASPFNLVLELADNPNWLRG